MVLGFPLPSLPSALACLFIRLDNLAVPIPNLPLSMSQPLPESQHTSPPLQSDSSAILARPNGKPKWRYTGQRLKYLRPDVYRQVVQMLAEPREHVPYTEIMRVCRVNDRTIHAVEQEEQTPIADRKQVLLKSYARIAQRAADIVETGLPKLNGREAIVTAAIATEKLLLLSGDPTVHVLHTIEPGPNLYQRIEEVRSRLASPAHALELPVETSDSSEPAP